MGRTACTEPQCLYRGDLYLYLNKFGDFEMNACELAQSWLQSLDIVFMVKGASVCKTRALSFLACFE